MISVWSLWTSQLPLHALVHELDMWRMKKVELLQLKSYFYMIDQHSKKESELRQKVMSEFYFHSNKKWTFKLYSQLWLHIVKILHLTNTVMTKNWHWVKKILRKIFVINMFLMKANKANKCVVFKIFYSFVILSTFIAKNGNRHFAFNRSDIKWLHLM